MAKTYKTLADLAKEKNGEKQQDASQQPAASLSASKGYKTLADLAEEKSKGNQSVASRVGNTVVGSAQQHFAQTTGGFAWASDKFNDYVQEPLLQKKIDSTQAKYEQARELYKASIGTKQEATARKQAADLLAELNSLHSTMGKYQRASALDQVRDINKIGTERIQRAQEGASDLGKTGLDVLGQMTQMGMDAFGGLATGGGLNYMTARVFGGALDEADARSDENERNGLDKIPEWRQLGYALTQAGIERGTESIGGIFSGNRFKMSSEQVVQLAKSTVGRMLLRLGLSGASEAAEELLSGVLDLPAQYWLDWNFSALDDVLHNKDGALDKWLQETGHSMKIAGLAGLAGGGAEAASGSYARSNAILDRVQQDVGEGASRTDWYNAHRDIDENTPASARTVGDTMNAQQYVERAVKSMGVNDEVAKAMISGFGTDGKKNARKYVNGVREAYMLGKYVPDHDQALAMSEASKELSDEQWAQSFRLGQMARAAEEAEARRASRNVEQREYSSIEDYAGTYEAPDEVTSIYNLTPETDINDFAQDFRSAYDLGRVWGNAKQGAKYLESRRGVLNADQAKAAYDLGVKQAAANAAKAETEFKGQPKANRPRKKGVVKYSGVKFNDQTRTAYRVMSKYAEITGVNVVLYDSRVDENGKYLDANGRFEWKDDTIYIDINAGLNNIADGKDIGNYTMLATFGHEFTHFAEKNSPTMYNAFRSYIFDMLEGRGENVEELIEKNMAFGLDYDAASREVVADSMSEILNDSKLAETLAREQPTVFKRILEHLKQMLAEIRTYFGKLTKHSPEAEALKENAHYLSEIVDRWDALAKDAVENYQARVTANETEATQELTKADAMAELAKEPSIAVTDSGLISFSARSWENTDKAALKAKLVAATGLSEEYVQKWLDDVTGVANIIVGDAARLDYKAAENMTMLKDNSEYIFTLDASTLCEKRRLYQGTYNAIAHRMGNRMLSSYDVIRIRQLLSENSEKSPCAICYVESRRRLLGRFASQWRNGYKGEYKPTLDEVVTTDGLERLRVQHPQAYHDFIDAMNKKGTANPKVVQPRTDYRGEILNLSKGNIAKLIRLGGIRVQSFSDFETPHLIDTMQAVMDMAAMNLTSQAYTKVPNFAWVFGDTSMKINLSLIADGVDESGRLKLSDTEGMPLNEALRIRDRYSKNVGTIVVVKSDAEFKAAMADERIDFIIPFHRSGWGKKQFAELGMTGATDYQAYQNEKDAKTGGPVKGGNFYPIDYWDYSKTGKENAERYLQLCHEQGRIPKFWNMLDKNADGSYSLKKDGSTDGYWKTLIDFKMYDNDGAGAPQEAVRPNFNMTEAQRVLNEYEGGADTLPVSKTVVNRFFDQKDASTAKSIRNELRKAELQYDKLSAQRAEMEDGTKEAEKKDAAIAKQEAKVKALQEQLSIETGENQIVQQDQTPAEGHKTQFSFRDAKVPTYDELVKKAPVKVTDVKAIRTENFKKARDDFKANEIDGLCKEPQLNNDTNTLVFLTKDTFTHSFSSKGGKQIDGFDTIGILRKLPEIIQNAVLTHAEPSRNIQDNTTGVYTMFSAIRLNGTVRPLKLKIKEYNVGKQTLPKNVEEYFRANGRLSEYASVYDGRALIVDDIDFDAKKEALGSAASNTSVKADADYSPKASTISVKDLLNLVKGDARKYIPENEKVQNSARPTQEFTSAKTSLNQVAALFKSKTVTFGKTNIDIGGGAFNATTEYLAERGTKNYVFDPFNRGADENKATFAFMRENGGADTATCANVLNVIKEAEARYNVILEVAKAIKPDGTAYFSVYQKDKDNRGRQTGNDMWQNSRATDTYVSEIAQVFDSVVRKGDIIIAKNPKAGLGKAYWQFSNEEGVSYSARKVSDDEAKANADAALKHFGRTYSWKEAGWLTRDGKLVDLSGKNDGAPGGYRTVDHRDIRDALGLDYGGEDYSGGMVQFMAEGNVRIAPESNGINVSVEPTEPQYQMLSKFITQARGEVLLDIDDLNGKTIASVSYEKGTMPREVLNEIGDYFDYGIKPTGNTQYSLRKGQLSDFEYIDVAWEDLQKTATPAESGSYKYLKDSKRRLESARKALSQAFKDRDAFLKRKDRASANKEDLKISSLRAEISNLEKSIYKVESTGGYKTLLRKARDIISQVERDAIRESLNYERTNEIDNLKATHAENVSALKKHFRDVQDRAIQRRKETTGRQKYRDRVQAETQIFRDWMRHPSNKDIRKHIPTELQKPVMDLLDSIDMSSKRLLRGGEATKADIKLAEDMRKVRDAVKRNIESAGEFSGYADLPPEFMEAWNNLTSEAERMTHIEGDLTLNQMSEDQLKSLYQSLKQLRKFITEMNVLHNNAVFKHAGEAAEETISHAQAHGSHKDSKVKAVAKFLNWDYMRPSYWFERLGSGAKSIEKEFRDGQAKMADLATQILEFSKKTFNPKQAAEWAQQEHTFTLERGGEVTLPTTHLMSLYCLSKRQQAQIHLYGDGIRVGNFERNAKMRTETVQDEGHIITPEDVQKMVAKLTPEQIAVADSLQKFMNTEGSRWGNEVSRVRFGTEQFTEENYFPIKSDSDYLQTTGEEGANGSGLYALLNMGFTKELNEHARNRIVLYNIFDVFAAHTADMAQYRSFALPVLDALKWYNYKTEDRGKSTKSALRMAYGEDAGKAIVNLLKAYNGTEAQGGRYDTAFLKLLHHSNGAAIAFNARVVIQQPTAIARAGMYLKTGNILAGLGQSVTHMKETAERMEKYSGIAKWKALGFRETNIARNLQDMFAQKTDFRETLMDVGTKGAEWADRFTWAAMWYACEKQTNRSAYETEDAYYKAVGDLFDEVIYKTQVVDSALTKAEFLRSKDYMARVMGSFMSESSATISMVQNQFAQMSDDLSSGMKFEDMWKKQSPALRKVMRVYIISSILNAAAQAAIDGLRDDDDYQNYFEKYFTAFKTNVVENANPLKQIAIVKDIAEIIDGMIDQTGAFDKINKALGTDFYGNIDSGSLIPVVDQLKKATTTAQKIVEGDDNYKWWSVIGNGLAFLSGVTGLPMKTSYRTIVSLWNTLVPSQKIKTYDAGEKGNIKYAYLDGHLTEDEAIDLMMEKELFTDRDKAWFEVRSWEGSGKYDDVKAAVISDDSAAYIDAMDVLTEHGIDESKANSAVKSFIKDIYTGDLSEKDTKLVGGIELSDEQAISLLMRYAGMEEDKATVQLTAWEWSADTEYSVSTAAVTHYNTYAAPAGVSRDTYLEVWAYSNMTDNDKDENGKTIKYSAARKIAAYINSLPLTADQKTALAESLGWSSKTIKKVKTW